MEGMRLKEIRLAQMKSQEDVSKATGLTEATISRLESGKHGPKLGTIRKLVEALAKQVLLAGRDLDAPSSADCLKL